MIFEMTLLRQLYLGLPLKGQPYEILGDDSFTPALFRVAMLKGQPQKIFDDNDTPAQFMVAIKGKAP